MPLRKRGRASDTPATQRQRVVNIGESSIAWMSTRAHAVGMEVTRDVAKLETVRRGQRQHDIVFGRRRLQLEIEFAAEALAQSQTPGPIEAAAERAMNDELHAARFIEEPLEDDRVLRRQAAKGGGARGEVVDKLIGRGRRRRRPHRRASAARVVPDRSELSRAAISARRRETAADSASVRPGASPSQKGMFGGWPLASSTRTVPRSTR